MQYQHTPFVCDMQDNSKLFYKFFYAIFLAICTDLAYNMQGARKVPRLQHANQIPDFPTTLVGMVLKLSGYLGPEVSRLSR